MGMGIFTGCSDPKDDDDKGNDSELEKKIVALQSDVKSIQSGLGDLAKGSDVKNIEAKLGTLENLKEIPGLKNVIEKFCKKGMGKVSWALFNRESYDNVVVKHDGSTLKLFIGEDEIGEIDDVGSNEALTDLKELLTEKGLNCGIKFYKVSGETEQEVKEFGKDGFTVKKDETNEGAFDVTILDGLVIDNVSPVYDSDKQTLTLLGLNFPLSLVDNFQLKLGESEIKYFENINSLENLVSHVLAKEDLLTSGFGKWLLAKMGTATESGGAMKLLGVEVYKPEGLKNITQVKDLFGKFKECKNTFKLFYEKLGLKNFLGDQNKKIDYEFKLSTDNKNLEVKIGSQEGITVGEASTDGANAKATIDNEDKLTALFKTFGELGLDFYVEGKDVKDTLDNLCIVYKNQDKEFKPWDNQATLDGIVIKLGLKKG